MLCGWFGAVLSGWWCVVLWFGDVLSGWWCVVWVVRRCAEWAVG